MFNLDPGKLIVIAVVAIILLGPDKLPQVARQVGAAWRSFGEFRHRMESEVRSTLPDLPSTSEIARLARSPSALLNHLSSMSEDEEQSAQEAAAPSDAATAGPSDAVAPEPQTADGRDGAQGSPTVPMPTTGGGNHDAGTNGSGPAGTASDAPPRPSSEPVVQADPNLN